MSEDNFYIPRKVLKPVTQLNLRVSAEWRAEIDKYCAKHRCTITDLVISSVNFAIARTKEPS